jgi:hypothetical protein
LTVAAGLLPSSSLKTTKRRRITLMGVEASGMKPSRTAGVSH